VFFLLLVVWFFIDQNDMYTLQQIWKIEERVLEFLLPKTTETLSLSLTRNAEAWGR
jgi:hypothetical protein